MHTTPLHPIKLLIDEARKLTAHSETPLSMTTLAKNANVSRETLYRLMRGEGGNTTVASVCAIAKAARIAPLVLLRLIQDDLAKVAATALNTLVDGDCSSFIRDVTIPDGSTVQINQRFIKTWELQNTGSVAWVGRQLQCLDSELVTARWVTPADGGSAVLVPLDNPWLTPHARTIAVADTEVDRKSVV